MKQIILSDYVGDQMLAAAQKRQADYLVDMQRHAEALAARNRNTDALRESAQVALRERRYLAWLLSLRTRWLDARSSSPPPPALAPLTRNENILIAGHDGEHRVAQFLAAVLDDEWTLISGYMNPGGEIDKLLVGPTCLLAIEVKYFNGRVYCIGDHWWKDRYDRFGNLVETGKPVDGRGRSPSAQVNAAADRLQAFLAKRASVRRVARCVVLPHEASELGRLEDLTVDFVATLNQLADGIVQAMEQGDLHGASVDRLVELIRRDHEYHRTRKASRALEQRNEHHA